MSSADVIVVGSGASAVHAAWPLVEAGKRVLMLDVGARDETYAPLIPDLPFTALRKRDENQHRYFLGDRFEGVPFGPVRVGAQLTPPRGFITRGVEELTPVEAPDFAGMESLGAGGLASGWGAGVGRFSAQDLSGLPIGPDDLAPHYAAVEQRIGVSGEHDDLERHLGRHEGMQPGLALDTPSRLIQARYLKSRETFAREGFALGVTRLAALSREFRGRGPHRRDDLDFWADKGKAVYRPRWTLEELCTRENFTYLSGRLVLSFKERAGSLTVRVRRVDDGEGEPEEIGTRALVLAAGVFGTARIVLRSLGMYDRPVPFVTNPYTYAPCINWKMIGREAEDARHSLSQLTAVYTPADGRPLHVSIYSYRSLLTFKLMKESPLSARHGLRVMRALIPAFSIFGVHHPDEPTPLKVVTMLPASGAFPDRLRIAYGLREEESQRIEKHEKQLFRQIRKLGCFPIKRVRPGPGSSIHYGGTFPMTASPGELQTSRDGLLSGTRAVYLADGSLLRSLPAKGLTLTLMANADRVGSVVVTRV